MVLVISRTVVYWSIVSIMVLVISRTIVARSVIISWTWTVMVIMSRAIVISRRVVSAAVIVMSRRIVVAPMVTRPRRIVSPVSLWSVVVARSVCKITANGLIEEIHLSSGVVPSEDTANKKLMILSGYIVAHGATIDCSRLRILNGLREVASIVEFDRSNECRVLSFIVVSGESSGNVKLVIGSAHPWLDGDVRIQARFSIENLARSVVVRSRIVADVGTSSGLQVSLNRIREACRLIRSEVPGKGAANIELVIGSIHPEFHLTTVDAIRSGVIDDLGKARCVGVAESEG